MGLDLGIRIYLAIRVSPGMKLRINVELKVGSGNK
jgi:hypothetical protein